MKIIKLSNSEKITTVDDEVYNEVIKFTWRLSHYGYAIRSFRIKGVSKSESLHRRIMNAKKGQLIDHINRDPLDNRKENLRFCSKSQNAMNSKLQSNNTSGHRGVYIDKRYGTFDVYINKNKKRYWLGSFSSKKEAVNVYNNAAKSLFGEFFNKESS